MFYRIEDWPRRIYIEPTNHCVLACYMCCHPIMSRNQGRMKVEFFSQIIQDIYNSYMSAGKELPKIQLTGQGEPFLHTQIFDLIRIAKSYGFYLDLISNGVVLRDKIRIQLEDTLLDTLKISVYGWDRESYQNIHGKDRFDQVIRNLIHLMYSPRSYELNIHLLDCPMTERVIDKLALIWTQFPVDYVFIHPVSNLRGILDKRQELPVKSRKIQGLEGFFVGKECIKSPIIHWDGSISPCSFDYDSDCGIGNLNQSGFAQIWFGSNNGCFRKTVYDGKAYEVYGTGFCESCEEADLFIDKDHKAQDVGPSGRTRLMNGGGRDHRTFLEHHFPLGQEDAWPAIFSMLMS